MSTTRKKKLVRAMYGKSTLQGEHWLCGQLLIMCMNDAVEKTDEEFAMKVLWQMSKHGILLNPNTANPFRTRKQLKTWFVSMLKQHWKFTPPTNKEL